MADFRPKQPDAHVTIPVNPRCFPRKIFLIKISIRNYRLKYFYMPWILRQDYFFSVSECMLRNFTEAFSEIS